MQQTKRKIDHSTLDRAEKVKASQEAVEFDEAFAAKVEEGDKQRDLGNWAAAQQAYEAALSLYPFQAGYWVQHAHMLKEQGNFSEAEISYRNACALGAPADAVMEHVRFVMAAQGVTEGQYPIRFYSDSTPAKQVPTRHDVEVFSRLIWNDHRLDSNIILDLMRTSETCDTLLSAMIGDPRFEKVNLAWLSVVEDAEL